MVCPNTAGSTHESVSLTTAAAFKNQYAKHIS